MHTHTTGVKLINQSKKLYNLGAAASPQITNQDSMYLYELHCCMVPVEVLCALPILTVVALYFSLVPHKFYSRKREPTPNRRQMQQNCHINYFVTRKQPKISIQLSKSTRWCIVLRLGEKMQLRLNLSKWVSPRRRESILGKRACI